ncbi:MAG: rod shape-determining protein MreD [Chloroflexi bacterium]|nr:rod shape-determining protein MreD [Chloroflexota bacterium]
MGLLSAAIGAIVAAILEVSVLSQLQLGGVTPELVLAMGIAVAMVAGFEAGMIWAFLGGLMLDMLLPERPLGATTLVLLLATGLALLVARVTEPPRIIVIAASAFVLSFMYQAVLLGLLAVTAGISMPSLQPAQLSVSAVLAAVIAGATAWVVRSLTLRFGSSERTDW